MRATRALALLVVAAVATHAPVLGAQQAAPAAATAPADTTQPARRVRELPVVFGGALVGGGLGLLAGAAAGAAIGTAADAPYGDEWITAEGVGAILGGALGYAVGAGVGAHFAASGKPRPNAFATIGISVLAAAAAGVVAGGLGSAGVNEATSYVLAAAVPVAHLALTAQFARWRAARATPPARAAHLASPTPAR